IYHITGRGQNTVPLIHTSCACLLLCFFFSSRRRHTRWPRDWSSDVCSSDLRRLNTHRRVFSLLETACIEEDAHAFAHSLNAFVRSEERRVGKECRSRRAPYR